MKPLAEWMIDHALAICLAVIVILILSTVLFCTLCGCRDFDFVFVPVVT